MKMSSVVLLLLIQLLSVTMLLIQLTWIPIAQIDSDFDDHCHSIYFEGFNAPKCNTNTIQGCRNDKKCTLCHNQFGCHVHDDYCLNVNECGVCECTGTGLVAKLDIALDIFVIIGVILECIKMVNIARLCTYKSRINYLDHRENSLFQFSQDNVLFICIMCFNDLLWSKIVKMFEQRRFFRLNGFFWIDLIFHQLPAHMVAGVVMYYVKDPRFSSLYWSSILLIIIIYVLKLGYHCYYWAKQNLSTTAYNDEIMDDKYKPLNDDTHQNEAMNTTIINPSINPNNVVV